MKSPQFYTGLVLAFMVGWLLTDHVRQRAELNEMKRYIGNRAVEGNKAPPATFVPLALSNAALVQAANVKESQAKEVAITQLFVKEQQQSVQRQVEAFLATTEPLLMSTNLDRSSLSKALTNADELHSKIDPNNFNPILEIRFEARRGTLQSLVKQQ